MTRTKIQIRWADVDQLRHVYNGQYQHFYDIAKSDYFEQVLSLDTNWTNSEIGLITAQTLNNYFLPIEMNDKIEITTVMQEIGGKSLKLFQEIINLTTGAVHSDSTSVMVGYNPTKKVTFEIPELWRITMSEDKAK